MGILAKFVDVLLYTNIWIAGAAASLYVYSQFLFTGNMAIDTVAVFVFATCVWLYSLHRFIGLTKVDTQDPQNRFYKIESMRTLIAGIATCSFLASLILVFYLTKAQIYVLAVPGILSLLYVLPVFKNQKRLRDINYIKIFVIALVWAGLTIALPLAACNHCDAKDTQILLFIERFIFVFAITLPFDIRDLQVDKSNNVKTISAQIGRQRTWIVCLLLLLISSAIFAFLTYQSMVGYAILYIHLAVNLITLICIWIAFWRDHDYYYTGLLDGTMYLPLILVFILECF